jgi:anaerobic ribonucleoside-triphosphate reductase activating protein
VNPEVQPPSAPAPTLRIGSDPGMLKASLGNGPGWRVCIWTQGCSIRCTEVCLNAHLLEARGGWLITPEALLAQVEAVRRREGDARALEGVTLLGGEPSDQAQGCADFFRLARAAGLTTLLYSGRTYEQLQRRAATDAALAMLLAHTDLLMDGPFVAQRYTPAAPWRGSDNQRLLRLSEAYSEAALEAALGRQRKAYSIRLTPGGEISVEGLQTPESALSVQRSFGAG